MFSFAPKLNIWNLSDFTDWKNALTKRLDLRETKSRFFFRRKSPVCVNVATYAMAMLILFNSNFYCITYSAIRYSQKCQIANV